MTNKVNNKKSQPKKLLLCHPFGALGHIWPNCYKWLATQQRNSMILPANQNQFPSSFAPLGDLFKAFMFLSNVNGFNSSPSSPNHQFAQRKDSSKVWKEKCFKWFSHFFFLFLLFMHYLFVLLSCFWVSLVLCFALFNMFLFVCFQFCFIFFFIKIKRNWKIRKIQKQCVLCVHCYLCILDGHWNKVL